MEPALLGHLKLPATKSPEGRAGAHRQTVSLLSPTGSTRPRFSPPRPAARPHGPHLTPRNQRVNALLGRLSGQCTGTMAGPENKSQESGPDLDPALGRLAGRLT